MPPTVTESRRPTMYQFAKMDRAEVSKAEKEMSAFEISVASFATVMVFGVDVEPRTRTRLISTLPGGDSSGHRMAVSRCLISDTLSPSILHSLY